MGKIIICTPELSNLSTAVAEELGVSCATAKFERFPDGERRCVLDHEVDGQDVAIVQSLAGSAGERLLDLLLLADVCLHGGARRLIAVLPYVAYVRQDRRGPGEALGGAVLARLVAAGRFARVIAVDLHAEAAEGWFGIPVEHLSAASALRSALGTPSPGTVVVSPDLGGAKRAERFARLLGSPVAVIHKSRLSGAEVSVHEVLGDVRGRPVILLDDMISTGGTIEAAAQALREAGCADELTVVATHALLVGEAIGRLERARIQRLLHTDSVPTPAELPFPRTMVSLAPLLASALRQA